MCEAFIMACAAPLFSFVFSIYALITGDTVGARAREVTQRITEIGKLDDQGTRAVLRLVAGYGSTTLMITSLVLTTLSYFASLFSVENVFGESQIYGLIIVIVPVLILAFSMIVILVIGGYNLFSYKVLSPFKSFGGRAAFGFTYGALINTLTSFLNLLLIAVFAVTLGIFECQVASSGCNSNIVEPTVLVSSILLE